MFILMEDARSTPPFEPSSIVPSFRSGPNLALPITSGGGLQSEVKLKQAARRPTFELARPVLITADRCFWFGRRPGARRKWGTWSHRHFEHTTLTLAFP